MHPDDRRVDAWETSPSLIVLFVMALIVLVALPFALLIFLTDLFTRTAAAEARPGVDPVSAVGRMRWPGSEQIVGPEQAQGLGASPLAALAGGDHPWPSPVPDEGRDAHCEIGRQVALV